MSVRVRTRPIALPSPQEKLTWADGRLARLRAGAAEAMRALAAELEEAAARLERAGERPDAGVGLTSFAAQAEVIDRLSLDMLYTGQLSDELRAAGVGSPDAAPTAGARATRPIPPAVGAQPANAGVSQSDIDAMIRARAKAG